MTSTLARRQNAAIRKKTSLRARAYDRALHRLDGDSVANADPCAVQRRVNARSQGIVHPRERRAPESARPPSPCLIEESGARSFSLPFCGPSSDPGPTHARIPGADYSPVSLEASPIRIPVPESRKPAQAGRDTHFARETFSRAAASTRILEPAESAL
jgi:hypothetical protein